MNEYIEKQIKDKFAISKRVSIIIPSWFEIGMTGKYNDINETYYIASKCLNRLLAVTPRNKFELIIINNGSALTNEDIPADWQSLDWYWSQADILINNETNLGFGEAINQGIKEATNEYIIQMNNDIWLFEGWLDAILEVFDKELNPPVGMVMPNLIKKEYQKDCLNEKGRLDFNKIFELKKENIILPRKDEIERHAQFGSLWCIKKELTNKLIEQDGFFFDPQFSFAFREDRDLYKRIYNLGYETYRTNKTRVGHIGNLSVSKLKNKNDITTKNRELFFKKWGTDAV